ncbi:MAG TPA: ABC transporter ATP-binding protein [Solirubrobacterales bacterium]|nr:ABC transporter ATP-binding protein [Solirubrobacterales bacterium]
MGTISCTDLHKSFGDVRAVDGLSLEVEEGATVALLGPSGCGKTTTLRLIAGFERPDSGTVVVAGQTLSGPGVFVPPEKRRIGVVFQDYALFPHYDVAGNVGYGLGRRADRDRVGEVMELVGLGGLGGRSVNELSGGQQQRVALARALAPAPELILLDEPFSNLDASLRAKIRDDVRTILEAQGVTSIFVTHDQEEALSVADTVAVVNRGRVEQMATPEEVYSRPSSRWVAGFLGEIEVLPGVARDGAVTCDLGVLSASGELEGEVDVLVRPESLAVDTVLPAGRQATQGVVVSRRYYGHDQMLELRLESGRIVRARRLGFPAWHPGDHVRVWIEGPADVRARGQDRVREAARPTIDG